MTDKSHVTLEQHRCFVCGKDFNTGAILLDQKLRPCFERNTVTGNGVCQEHQKIINDGYIILIGATDERGECRTGDICYLRESVFARMFNIPVPEKKIAFIEPAVVTLLKEMHDHAENSVSPHQEGQESATGSSSDRGDGSERAEGSGGVGNGEVPPEGQLLQTHGPSEVSGASEFTAASSSVRRDADQGLSGGDNSLSCTVMTDKELLELAAKAAGIGDAIFHGPIEGMWSNALDEYWNPLTNDGDALRLAVKLHMSVTVEPREVWAGPYAAEYQGSEGVGNDPYATTRRAIVRAAAEIGKGMK